MSRSAATLVDDHTVTVQATAENTWRALTATIESWGGGGARSLGARALGCVPAASSGGPLVAGAEVPGFRVDGADEPSRLSLSGRHRFSRYQLRFTLQPDGAGRSVLTAHTDADFPGLSGRVYHGLLTGLGLHRAAVERMLRGIRDRAES